MLKNGKNLSSALASPWGFLFGPNEKAQYEERMRMTAQAFPFFLGINFFGYVMSTLIFLNTLSPRIHILLGASLLVIAVFSYFCVRRFPRWVAAGSYGDLWLLMLVGFLIVAWWNAYGLVFYLTRDVIQVQQYMFLVSIISLSAIALVVRFARIYSALVVATAIHVMFALLSWGTDASKLLMAQLLVSVLAQLFFLRVTNNMIGKLLKIRHENTELVGVLQQKNTALEQSNLSQSRYLSAASHDLRQPLHALALLTNDAQRKNQVPAVGETLKKIDLAIDSLSQSFNAMLNLSRLDAGVVKPEFTRFPIQRLFNRLQIEFADTAAAKGLSFNVRSSRAWVLSDEGMLYSILSNFVSNALRYTDEGGVVVGVRAINAQTLRLMVYDTGSGVPTEKARQIFQEYLRLEDAQQRVQGGVGLGLAISERMARLLGAKLLVQSVMKQGSSFGLIVSQVEPLEESSHLAMARIDTEDHLAGVRVAIVDDDETALESLGELLESWGMDVTEVLSAEMLRESVTEEGAFDMVISDYHLSIPDENGLDIICAARKLPGMATAHCLLLTGDTSTELAAAVQTTGAVIWYKPLRPARLRAYLNTIMKDAA